jgi:hypothetical protein
MWKCRHCHEKVDDNLDVCWNCGYSKEGKPPTDPSAFQEQKKEVAKFAENETELLEEEPSEPRTRPTGREISETRYPNLRLVASVYRALGWLVAGVAVLAAIGALVTSRDTGFFQIVMFLAMLLLGVVGFVSFVAFAEGIQVFLDIEENTRRAATRRK